jgi:polyvinyl alcohol dehydrogenase (cytochrome)
LYFYNYTIVNYQSIGTIMKLSAAAFALLVASCSPALAQQSGAALYAQHCASCHDAGDEQSHAPSRSALRSMPFEHVLGIITSGSMADMTSGRTADERKAIASFVAGGSASEPPLTRGSDTTAECANRTLRFAGSLEAPRWNGWGADINNSRFQPLEMARLTPDQVPRLQLKWAFGFPGGSSTIGQPTVIGGVLFVGGADRKLHALDAKTGCTLWTFTTDAPVRSAVTFGPLSDTDQFAVYFGDMRANAYAVNAATGALVWKTKVEGHPAARITGSPTLFSGLLYVPVSSIEEATGSRPTYECCTFRGSVVALDAPTGRQIWKAYTIPEAPHPTSKNAVGVQLHGPSGASVWSSPTIDVQRGALYVATGNSYSNPAADTSDAIVAFDLRTGQMLWHRQATSNDSYVEACYGADKTNCPEDRGPDYDFGQSPILASLRDGRRMLVIGQKSGIVHAFDPDEQGSRSGKRGWATVGRSAAWSGVPPRIRTASTLPIPTCAFFATAHNVSIRLRAEGSSRSTCQTGTCRCGYRRLLVQTASNAVQPSLQPSPSFQVSFSRAALAAICVPMRQTTGDCFGNLMPRATMPR